MHFHLLQFIVAAWIAVGCFYRLGPSLTIAIFLIWGGFFA